MCIILRDCPKGKPENLLLIPWYTWEEGRVDVSEKGHTHPKEGA